MISEALSPSDKPSSTCFAAGSHRNRSAIRFHSCRAAISRSWEGALDTALSSGEITLPLSVGVRISDSGSLLLVEISFPVTGDAAHHPNKMCHKIDIPIPAALRAVVRCTLQHGEVRLP